ncbi:MAG: UDP-N-acetylmuramoyl-L-alanyl-D-glutamate--2,6-diaminopimelate ligase [Clostridiales bacterium]|jgi:UDP-N-acetylmuramoyl-L-alanyl-D-glutamate--2,6-diaminopimelate ligase|nr:UDP-N-acetylmuramoyl-L-alanyl-D-glutamate--2,6-diaminopimelate ligase [Eubacteriales bacterium]MDD4710458.1 UDP-N-acetylmuramoyl-L-alanyl-D-glutamate--2,6-diaminopimelate ligase [Eubacteriales bacterium]NLO16446.1 UDP-N-acetylmuramoyl-L-alanyl-D-glutamate--2,6-diaminopimelate ligase [Clostridiales bacterium]
MYLKQLAQAAEQYCIDLIGDCDIRSLSQDSRQKTDLGLFFCISGTHFDAHAFAPQAISNGAVALVVRHLLPDLAVPQLVVTDDRAAMALIAAEFYGNPAQKLRMIGITGTKGKTTTSYLVKSILDYAGIPNGLIGTTGNKIGSQWMRSNLTTPDPIELHDTLRQMVDAGVEAVCMEVSAHALAMRRLDGITYEAACFTNFSQDHLDYFETMDKYFDTKKGYFTSGAVKNAAFNVDDDKTEDIVRSLAIPFSTYGISANADIFARDIEISENGVDFVLSLWNEQRFPVHMKMMGMFNVYNALAATALALIMGVEPRAVCAGLEQITSVPGRAEVLDTHTPYKVVLDYSHSPAAMENILETVRGFVRNRIILVFGCGGDRDHGKRSLMGEAAGRGSDYTIITSDNPRTENPLNILLDIEKGIKRTRGVYELIENRRVAINKALTMAQEGDVVILAGKGDETYQDINGVKKPFDEKQIVKELLSR